MMRDSREWLEADGLGGFASGTVDGIRTRRYHATLLAATRPPEGRMVLVADLELYVETPAGRYGLSSHDFNRGYIHPEGASHLTSFQATPWPTWEWALPDGTRIRGELCVPHGRPATALRWTKLAGPDATFLSARPFLAVRDYHSSHHANPAFRFEPEQAGERVTWRAYDGCPDVHVVANALYQHSPDWYRDFYYAAEEARGLDAMEDLAGPGTFAFDLSQPATMLLSTDAEVAVGLAGSPNASARVDAVFASEKARRAKFGGDRLALAADSYIVQRGAGQTVIAGYPWFADWGRDTFISLRGLCLATGRMDTARRILLEWAGVVSKGMLPNRFDEHNAAPEFNSVDAALWYVVAGDAYLAAGGSAEDRKIIEAAIDEIVAGYASGTRHNIRADSDGLLAAGERGYQLTWMDAKVGDWVVTPRIGKPVEINALWINALAIAGRRTSRWKDAAEKARASFAERFWNADKGQLFDVIDCEHVPGTVDATTRPNQVFAVGGGLPLAVIDGARAKQVVDAAFAALWTSAGPRSLAEDDPRYSGKYGGNGLERDRVYHNGPVWPWLAGAFVEAWVKVNGGTAEAKKEARTKFFTPMMARLDIAGLGHIAEICEGGAPHTPVGCPFQAWSVAELLRLDRLVLK